MPGAGDNDGRDGNRTSKTSTSRPPKGTRYSFKPGTGYVADKFGNLELSYAPKLQKGIRVGDRAVYTRVAPRKPAATAKTVVPKTAAEGGPNPTPGGGGGTIIREPTPVDSPTAVVRTPDSTVGSGAGQGPIKEPKRGVRRVRTGGGRRRSLSGKRGGGGGARRVTGARSQGTATKTVRLSGNSVSVNPTLGVS